MVLVMVNTMVNGNGKMVRNMVQYQTPGNYCTGTTIATGTVLVRKPEVGSAPSRHRQRGRRPTWNVDRVTRRGYVAPRDNYTYTYTIHTYGMCTYDTHRVYSHILQ